MEPTESSENKSKSILKTPKPRQPLQPVDFSARSNELTPTGTKSKRRVSFAEKKRIKEFCDSGEHSSYEVSELSTNKIANSLDRDEEINLNISPTIANGDYNDGEYSTINVQLCSDINVIQTTNDYINDFETNSVNNRNFSCAMNIDDYPPIHQKVHSLSFQIYEDQDNESFGKESSSTDQETHHTIIQQPIEEQDQIYLNESMEFTSVVSVLPIQGVYNQMEKDCHTIEENMSSTVTEENIKQQQLNLGSDILHTIQTNVYVQQPLPEMHSQYPTILTSAVSKFPNEICTEEETQAFDNKTMTMTMALGRIYNNCTSNPPILPETQPRNRELMNSPRENLIEEKETETFNNKSMTITTALGTIYNNCTTNSRSIPEMQSKNRELMTSPWENLIEEKETERFNNKSMTITTALGTIYNNCTTNSRSIPEMQLKNKQLMNPLNENSIEEKETETFNNKSMTMTTALGTVYNNYTTNSPLTPEMQLKNRELMNPLRENLIEKTETFNNKSMTMTTALGTIPNHCTSNPIPYELESNSNILLEEQLKNRTIKGSKNKGCNELNLANSIREPYPEEDGETEAFCNKSMTMTTALGTLTNSNILQENNTTSNSMSYELESSSHMQSRHCTFEGSKNKQLINSPRQNFIESEETEAFSNKSMTMTTALGGVSNNYTSNSRLIPEMQSNNRELMNPLMENLIQEEETETFNNKSMTMTTELGTIPNHCTSNPISDELESNSNILLEEQLKNRTIKGSKNKGCNELNLANSIREPYPEDDGETEAFCNKSMTMTTALGGLSNNYTSNSRLTPEMQLKNRELMNPLRENLIQEEETETFNNKSMTMTTALGTVLHNRQYRDQSKNKSMTEVMALALGLNIDSQLEHSTNVRVEIEPSKIPEQSCAEQEETELFNNPSMVENTKARLLSSSLSTEPLAIDKPNVFDDKSGKESNIYPPIQSQSESISDSMTTISPEKTIECFNNKSMTYTIAVGSSIPLYLHRKSFIQDETTLSENKSIPMGVESQLGENISRDENPILELSQQNTIQSPVERNLIDIPQSNVEDTFEKDESNDKQQTTLSFMKDIDLNIENLQSIELSLVSNETIENYPHLNANGIHEKRKNHPMYPCKRTLEDLDESNESTESNDKRQTKKRRSLDDSSINPIFDTNTQKDESNTFGFIVEKLKLHSLRDECIWKVSCEAIEKSLIVFAFMGGSLLIAVYFSINDNNHMENIQEIKTISLLKDSSNVLMGITHRLLLEELNPIALKNLNNGHEIFTLLNCVSEKVKSTMNFMFDLRHLDDTNLMEIENERISFTTYSAKKNIILKVTVNTKLFNIIDVDDVSVCCILGDVRKEQVKQLIKNVKRDYKFLRRYMNDVQDYVNLIEKSNLMLV